MNNNQNNPGLILSVIFASAVISGSLVYFGMQVKGGDDVVFPAGSATVDEALIAQKVEEGIDAYIQKQIDDEQAAVVEQEKSKSDRAKSVKRVSKTDDHIYGNVDAKVSLIEYSDFQCPYCTKFHVTAKQAVDQSDGQVNWVYRHFPLSFHDPLASKIALGSECAADVGGNDKFWAFTDKAFEVFGTANALKDDDDIKVLATSIGVDAAKFNDCYDGGKFTAHIKSDTKEGRDAGITGTPGNILINNGSGDVVVVSGAQSLSRVEAAIDSLL